MGQTAIGPERSEGRRLEAPAGNQGLYPKSKPPAMRVVMIMRRNGLREVRQSEPSGKRQSPSSGIAPPSYAERPPAATFREGTSGPGGKKAPKDALVAGRVICPSAEFSSSRPAPKGREREYRPFINRALHESSGFCAMEGWMLAASTVSIIRVGRVENPIRAPDKRLNNSEQNLKMERSARALCTLMIGFRPWI